MRIFVLLALISLAMAWDGVQATSPSHRQTTADFYKPTKASSQLSQEQIEREIVKQKLYQYNFDKAKRSFTLLGLIHALSIACNIQENNAKELDAIKRNVRAQGFGDKEIAAFMKEYQACVRQTLNSRVMKDPALKTCSPQKRAKHLQERAVSMQKLEAETQLLMRSKTR